MSNFVVTQVGLDAVLSVAEQGLKLVLSTFRVGSGVGYTPLLSDTGLRGTQLYVDQITSFRIAGDGSLVATCTMAVDAGPFQFGEIGIYTQAGQLFALATFDELQTKYSSLGANIASTYSFDVFLRLGQATAVIEIDSVTAVTASQVIGALGYTPYNAANPIGYITGAGDPNANMQVRSLGVGTPPTNVEGTITATGDISTTGNVRGFQTSDPKFKTDIRHITNGLDTIRGVRGYTFRWTQDYLAKVGGPSQFYPEYDIGVLATEVQNFVPLASFQREDGTLAVAYDKLIPPMLSALQELDMENRMLRNRMKALEDDVTRIQNQIYNRD